jgi:hypothetical protein
MKPDYTRDNFEGENSVKRKTTLIFFGDKSNTFHVYSTSVLNSDGEINIFYSLI